MRFIFAAAVLLGCVLSQEPDFKADAVEKSWDSSKWAQVVSKVFDEFRGKIFKVGAKEWEKHQESVTEWLHRQKTEGAIARGGCYKVYGSRSFAKFWYRENTKRVAGEPHFQGASWFGVTEAAGQDASEGFDQVFHFCAYQAAPEKAAPYPPRPGEVPMSPPVVYTPKSEGVEPALSPATKTPRVLVGAESRPPPAVTPRITFSSRYSNVKVGNREGPFKFKEVYDSSAPSTRGYCTADVSVFTDVANNNLCPSGAREDIAYEISVKFFPEVSKSWQFRLGPSFSMGGASFVDGQAEDSRPENLWWKGHWESEDVFITPRRAFHRGKWHEVVFYGLSACCDGKMSLQFDAGHGWEDATVENIKKAQVDGWTPASTIEGLALGRGEGTHSFSVVETGTANFGSHQTAWTLNQVDGIASFVRRIKFGVFFNWAPVVQVYLRRLDSSREDNVRVFVRAKNVNSDGFDLEIVKYGNTRVFQVGVSYFAFDADPMYGTKFGHACAKGSFADNLSLPKDPHPLDAEDDHSVSDLLLSQAGQMIPAVPAYAAVPPQKWTLDTFSGFRKYEVGVPFRDPLPDKPTTAFVGINMLDANKDRNVVTTVKLFNLGDRGVDFEFNTAGESEILAEGACMLAWTPVRREIATGELALSSLLNPSRWNLNEGRGLREMIVRVNFPRRFGEPPNVLLAINHINAATKHNVRFDVTLHSKDSLGFNVRIATWGQSSLTAITVAWLATADGRTNGLAPDTPGEKSEIYKDPRIKKAKITDDEWADREDEKKNRDNNDDAHLKLAF